MSPPETLRIVLDTADIEALAWGDTADPVALLLHGFPDSAWTWAKVGPALAAQGWRVIAPFARGYAPSSLARDDDYSIGSLVGDVIGIHRAVGADPRAVVVGHDWGGAVASAVSSSHPELFSRVVLIAIPPLPAIKALARPGLWPTLARQMPRSWYMAVLSVPILSEMLGDRLIRLLWRLWAPRSDVAEYRRRALESLNDRPRRRAAFSYYRAVWNPVYRRSREHRPEQQRAFRPPRNPVLFLQGADDTCGLERTGAHALEHLPPRSRRIVIAGAGHFAHLERPDIVVDHIVEYLSEGVTA